MPESSSTPALSRSTIVNAILSSSPVTRLAITCPDERLRERAADELAGLIIERIRADDQLRLAI
jgi:hypothetical protein